MIYDISESCVLAGLSWVALLLMRSWLGLLTWLHSAGSLAGPTLSGGPLFCVWVGWASWGLPGPHPLLVLSPSIDKAELFYMDPRKVARSLKA